MNAPYAMSFLPQLYIGVIGSQRKIDTIMEHLRTDGFTDDQLARVRAPIGMDLGRREMAQIALAIMTEIEVVRHGGSGQPRSEGMKIILLCVHYHYSWHTGRMVFWKLCFLGGRSYEDTSCRTWLRKM